MRHIAEVEQGAGREVSHVLELAGLAQESRPTLAVLASPHVNTHPAILTETPVTRCMAWAAGEGQRWGRGGGVICWG